MNRLPGHPYRRPVRRQSGFSMIEVLVTLIILLVGLLGLAGLMMQSQRSEMESYQRVQALILLQQMAGRINANRLAGAPCYAYTSSTVANPYPGSPYVGNTSALASPAAPALATSVTVPSCTSANVITAYTNLLNVISPQATNPTAYAQYLNSITTVNAGTGTNAAQAAAATALADLLAWHNDLLGAAESAGGANTGAMVGARGCISYDPNTELLNSSLVPLPGSGVYTLSIAWQGLGDTYANTSLLCGQGQYGPETRLRVVSLTLRIGSVDNNT